MRIGIATFGCDGGRSGIGQYLIHLLHGFARCSSTDEFEVLVTADERETFGGGVGVSALTLPARLGHPLVNLVWHQTSLPVWCWRRAYDVLFIAAANRRLPFAVPCPTVGTVHDLAPVHVAAKYDRLRQLYVCHVLPLLVRRLQRVITVSECSRDDVVRYARVPADRVTVVHNGVDHSVYRPDDREAARERLRLLFGLEKPYLLYVSRLEHPGKNHVRLIEAFELLKASGGLPHQLVLAGPDKERADEVHAVADRSPFRGDIVFTGFTAAEHLPLLYQAADLFVMPSLYEGFGIPILEAMACGTPVVCSSAGALPEVAGGAALLAVPYDARDMALKLSILLNDAEARRRFVDLGLRRAAGFHWQRTAEKTLAVLRETVEERGLQRCAVA